MTKKERCKEIMQQLFGAASASQVDSMTEENCVETCRTKVTTFLGKDKAKVFDNVS